MSLKHLLLSWKIDQINLPFSYKKDVEYQHPQQPLKQLPLS